MPQQKRAKLEASLRKIEALETQVTGPLDFEQYADMLAEAKSQLLGVIKAAADITKMCALSRRLDRRRPRRHPHLDGAAEE